MGNRRGVSKITIGLASPEGIIAKSKGEVLKDGKFNSNRKCIKDGLFCEKIFGPTRDWHCQCGRKSKSSKGIVCGICGVEVTEKIVRRERTGHINLAVPVVNPLFLTYISYLIDLPKQTTGSRKEQFDLKYKKSSELPNPKTGRRKIKVDPKSLSGWSNPRTDSRKTILNQIIYYEKYVVIAPGIKESDGLKKFDYLTFNAYFDIIDNLPVGNQSLDDNNSQKFIAKTGADAINDLLKLINLEDLSHDLRHKVKTETDKQHKNEALKRLQVVESFRKANINAENRPEWMVLKTLQVIPPDLRPNFISKKDKEVDDEINELYGRVIRQNERVKKSIKEKKIEPILRAEMCQLQKAVDNLFVNPKSTTLYNKPKKSLSERLKGKDGQFRQNMLGKRVDFSGRSVIVVGPELKLNECGLPKEMAVKLFKPFIIRRLISNGYNRTCAIILIDRRDPDSVIWEILEDIMKGHPILLNRAPTLHRLNLLAFQPKLIEGKAIQLHPLVCTGFNADFDGDQMAVHVPLFSAAIEEAQRLMLASQNILNPANGDPITVPSQDMVLGLYYMTKAKKNTKEMPVKGNGLKFYSAEEAIIAFNQKKIDLHANVWVRASVKENEIITEKLIETTLGRILFNQVVPNEMGYINELLTKKKLRDIISDVLKVAGVEKTAKFLDDIKDLGYYYAFKGGLSFNLNDVVIPKEKEQMIKNANLQIDEVRNTYSQGLITNNERYNRVIDIWTDTNTKITKEVMEQLSSDRQGFNSIYMMLDSGARGSTEQFRQLAGMRGLMAKPQKSGITMQEIIENPIISNFREGLSIQEYFISTHGARKGLADTALKTSEAGYLTRRLVDVSQDVIITGVDCGTACGLTASTFRKNDEIVETLYDKILGRVSLHDIHNPTTGELIVPAGEEITEYHCDKVKNSPIENVEIRSVLTCEMPTGVCSKCYGRNLATGKMVQTGEAVGVIAAQSIGEPGTQLILRTFHTGGAAANIMASSKIEAKYDGIVEMEEVRNVTNKGNDTTKEVVISRSAELKIVDKNTGLVLTTANVPYGSFLYTKNGAFVKAGTLLCDWDPYNAVIISEFSGIAEFEFIEEGVTFTEESSEQTGFKERVIIESKDKTKRPIIKIVSKNKMPKPYNIPVGSHIIISDGDSVEAGHILVKMPRISGKSGDITGGLPKVNKLFEARNPSNPAILSEIDGVLSLGITKGNKREVIIESKNGVKKTYLIPLSKQFLVQERDFVKACEPLTDGTKSLTDILFIKGSKVVQEFLVNEMQEVYRLQGVKINNKHFEVIIRQMLRYVKIISSGDSSFLEGQIVEKQEFEKANKAIATKNDSVAAKGDEIILGITKSALNINSFMGAASFQETIKVLTEAAINRKVDDLNGTNGNIIIGNLLSNRAGEYEKMDAGVEDKAEKK